MEEYQVFLLKHLYFSKLDTNNSLLSSDVSECSVFDKWIGKERCKSGCCNFSYLTQDEQLLHASFSLGDSHNKSAEKESANCK